MGKGNWIWVPENNSDRSSGLIGLFILFLLLLFAPIILALYSLFLDKEDKWKVGIFIIIGYIYFLIDLNYKWISGWLFYGYKAATSGEFIAPLFENIQYLNYAHIANFCAAAYACILLYLHFSRKNKNGM